METPERHRRRDDSTDSAPRPDGGGGLERTRRAGEDFLSAGDEAIQRALSGDSEQFLRQVRQTGGQ